MDKKFTPNSIELQKYQLNRYPFLMIDYVDEFLLGKYAHRYKNLILSAWLFPVHFPGGLNMHDALQLEALAQILMRKNMKLSKLLRGAFS
jgi:3-hydroxyacyl-[acyl-carrier-protein] dehydratase